MDGPIELPGDANPLTPQSVLLALQSAGSNQQLHIHEGTKQLQSWETRQGYHTLLQAVYLDRSIPPEIRYLAVIQLKNGIDKYWRKAAANAIKPQEKSEIRSRLIDGGINEPDTGLAVQNSLVVSKVVRIDYPQEWPDVLTELIARLREANTGNVLALKRGLLILLQIVKELSTARLRRSQTSLQSVTPEIVYLLTEIYTQKVGLWTRFLASEGGDEGAAIDAMESSLYALKILRRLLISGYEYPNHATEVQELWAHSQQQFGQFLDLVSRDSPAVVSPTKDVVEKHLLQFSKLHANMANTHPAAFALLPNSLDLVRAYWGLVIKYGDIYGSPATTFTAHSTGRANGPNDDTAFMEKLSLKGLVIMRLCMKMVFNATHSFKYRTKEVKEEQTGAIRHVKSSLLTHDLVGQMAEVIVTKFFVFRQVDLESWEEEPSEWEVREEGGGDTWEFEVRSCAEKLFTDLVINFKQLLIQPLLALFDSVTGNVPSDIVTKDSVYTAMGLSANVIFQEFDFDSFLSSTLVNDIQQSGPNYRVLRRRIAILMGQWVVIKVSEENRTLVYQIFRHLLNPQDGTNDEVVRVTATRHFKTVVDDFSFVPGPFLPFAPDIISQLMALIQEVESVETKMVVLETIRTIAVRLDTDIAPFADAIVSLVPGLWEASGEEHLMKQALLTILSNIVTSMKEGSQKYQPLILPLIQQAVIPGSEIQIYLMEEALDLWSSILTQSPSPPSADVLSLAESAFPLLEMGSENLRTVLSIVDSYILLAPQDMMSNVARQRLASYMTELLGVTKRDLAGLVITIVERMIRTAEALGGPQGVAAVVRDLYDSGFTEKVMEGLKDAWDAHQTSGPNRRYPKLDDVVETDYFTVLARIAVADPFTFSDMMGSIGDLESTFNWVLTEWFRHFDSMANVDRQKLSCLGLTRLLELPKPVSASVLAKLQDYFAMWTSVIREMQDGRDDGGDNLLWTDTEGNEYDTPDEIRKRLQSTTDVVHTVHTFDFVKGRLAQAIESCGGEAHFQEQYAVNVDRDVIGGFQALSM